MKKIPATLLFIFSVCTLFAQQKAGDKKDVTVKKKVAFLSYSDAKEKVSIKYPATWEHKPYSTVVFMFMRRIEEQGQKFRENVNLAVGSAEDLYLIEYLEDARKKFKDTYPDFKELKSLFIKINGLDFVRMIYRFSNKQLVVQSVLYLTVQNGKAYSLTCTGLDTTFDKFYPTFEEIAHSFRIK